MYSIMLYDMEIINSLGLTFGVIFYGFETKRNVFDLGLK